MAGFKEWATRKKRGNRKVRKEGEKEGGGKWEREGSCAPPATEVWLLSLLLQGYTIGLTGYIGPLTLTLALTPNL